MKGLLDLFIIGAGPIGLACGIEAKRAGLNYQIVDKGCLVNSIYNYPRNMTFFSTSDRLEIGEVPFISNNPKPTRPEALEYYRRVAMKWELNIKLYEPVVKVEQEDIFHITTNSSGYQAKKIIVATGFYDRPFLLHVPGENLSKVKHYYDDPHPYFGMNVAVVGAANSAVDVALETYRKGAKNVTMIIREEEIQTNVKYWSRPDIINRIKEKSIDAYFNSQITEITHSTIKVKTATDSLEIDNDFVLAMTGYEPDFGFLKKMGIKTHKDGYQTPEHNPCSMETNVQGVYLAGVVCGGLKTNKWFIENSRVHAKTIIQHIMSNLKGYRDSL